MVSYSACRTHWNISFLCVRAWGGDPNSIVGFLITAHSLQDCTVLLDLTSLGTRCGILLHRGWNWPRCWTHHCRNMTHQCFPTFRSSNTAEGECPLALQHLPSGLEKDERTSRQKDGPTRNHAEMKACASSRVLAAVVIFSLTGNCCLVWKFFLGFVALIRSLWSSPHYDHQCSRYLPSYYNFRKHRILCSRADGMGRRDPIPCLPILWQQPRLQLDFYRHYFERCSNYVLRSCGKLLTGSYQWSI